MFYTGYADLQDRYPETRVVQKPATGDVLRAVMSDLIGHKRIDAGLPA
jgi:hypothetical protein